MSETRRPLLQIRRLCKTFRQRQNGWGNQTGETFAVQNVSFDILQGETFALVGESGSGKTTLGRCLLKFIPADRGSVFYDGVDLLQISERRFRPYRRQFQMIFQNPAQALNPRQKVSACLAEPLKVHTNLSKIEILAHVQALFNLVGLDVKIAARFPAELSGGQQQRVAIARALAMEPTFLIADEPTASLDAAHKRQLIELLDNLKKQLGLTLLLITHDLALAAATADRIGVMYHGQLVEIAPTQQLFDDPAHTYSRILVDAARVFNHRSMEIE